jgi:hypothetical protein
MSYATVMVNVDADGAPEQRVRLAAGLADKFNATLIGLSALSIRPAIVADAALLQDVTQADIKAMRAKLADREAGFAALPAPITASSNGGPCSTSPTGRWPMKPEAPISW